MVPPVRLTIACSPAGSSSAQLGQDRRQVVGIDQLDLAVRDQPLQPLGHRLRARRADQQRPLRPQKAIGQEDRHRLFAEDVEEGGHR
ncbi:MAG: hypothetical protein V9H69_28065 [Anaerolineae bacterium]